MTDTSRWKTCQAKENHSLLITMSLLHEAGNSCAVGELDLHALPVSQKDILKTIPITKTTNNALTDTTTSFNFTFEPSSNYTDLNVKVTRMEGCQKWIPDTAGQMDTRAAANAGWVKRRADSVGDECKSVVGKPHLDM